MINKPSHEASVIHRVCEPLDHPALQANLLRQTYEERGRIEIDGGKWLRVLAHKAWNARPFGPDGLPCFDPSVVRVGG